MYTNLEPTQLLNFSLSNKRSKTYSSGFTSLLKSVRVIRGGVGVLNRNLIYMSRFGGSREFE